MDGVCVSAMVFVVVVVAPIDVRCKLFVDRFALAIFERVMCIVREFTQAASEPICGV